jgi:hypothetical protein
MGRHLLEGSIPSPVSYSSLAIAGVSIFPPCQPPQGEAWRPRKANEDEGTIEKHPRLLPWKDPCMKMTARRPPSDLKDDIFCMGPHMSCNQTRVIRELYRSYGTPHYYKQAQ